MSNFIDLTNKKFNKLSVIKRTANTKSTSAMWLCKCDCGNEVIIRSSHLIDGTTKSCGCLRKQILNHTTHNLSHSKIYNVYYGMKKRCYSLNNASYKRYGGRGIKICDEWLNDFMNFYNWSMENEYEKELQIDRINNNGNYEPTNCRWVTPSINSNNRSNNIGIVIDGKTHNLYEWEKISGVRYQTIKNRFLRGVRGSKLLNPTNVKGGDL